MARQAKHAGQSEKRRKMAQDLERREEMSKAERSQEKAARDKLQVYLNHCHCNCETPTNGCSYLLNADLPQPTAESPNAD